MPSSWAERNATFLSYFSSFILTLADRAWQLRRHAGCDGACPLSCVSLSVACPPPRSPALRRRRRAPRTAGTVLRAASSQRPPAPALTHSAAPTAGRPGGSSQSTLFTEHLSARAPPARPLAGCARACEPCRRHQPAHRRELHCPVHVARPALQPEPHQIRPSRGRSRTGAGAARGQGGPYLPEAAWDAAQETGARAWRWCDRCTCASWRRSLHYFARHRHAGRFIKQWGADGHAAWLVATQWGADGQSTHAA